MRMERKWQVLEESGIHSKTRVVTRFLPPSPGAPRPSRSHCSDTQEGWCSCGFGWALRFSDELDLQLPIRGKSDIIDSVKYSCWGDMQAMVKSARAAGTETSLVRENRRLQGKVKPGKNLRCEGKRGARTSQEWSRREREFDDLEKKRKILILWDAY